MVRHEKIEDYCSRGEIIEAWNYVVDINKLVRFRLLLLQNQLMGLSFRREGSPMEGKGNDGTRSVHEDRPNPSSEN